MKLNFILVRKILFFSLLAALVFGLGFVAGRQEGDGFKVTISRDLPAGKANLDFSLFWKVWDTLEASYFDQGKMVPANMVYGAIAGMVSSLGDPYTVFLPPSENKVVQEDLQGNFEGVGIQIGFRGTSLAVIAPLPGTPAQKAGVRAGDLIVGIRDEAKDLNQGTAGITLPEAVKAIRGPAGSKITLVLLRDGLEEPVEVEITRESIEVPSLTLEFLEENGQKVAHLKLLKFGAETNGEWEKAVTRVSGEAGLAGMVLDLRSNPGGYLQGAIDYASEFLDAGKLVVIQEGRLGQKEEFRVVKNGRLKEIKVVVLVDKGSASASEILAGALKDNTRAQIVGQTTFGKGTIQEPIQLNGAGLHLTIARWLTPNGAWVNDAGLKPDVEVEDNTETIEDEQLLEAIELI